LIKGTATALDFFTTQNIGTGFDVIPINTTTMK
jgi:hypothetical protein